MPHRPACLKRPVGRPRKSSATDSDSPEPCGTESSNGTQRGIYHSYSLSQKVEIIFFAKQHSEAAANRKYAVSRSTIYRDLAFMPREVVASSGKVLEIARGKCPTIMPGSSWR